MENKHLPLMGVGPIYVIIITLITFISIILTKLNIILKIEFKQLNILFIIIGIILIIAGIYMWISTNFISKLDDNIKQNKLVTDGIYAYVRNPIYSAFLFICTGIILIENNLYLLILPILYWIFLTILMKKTEEKWLTNLYGNQYIKYCKKTNRCLPWFHK